MEEDELGKLAEPLIKYIKENCHPHMCIIVTDERVAVVETVLSIPNEYVN